MVIDLCPETFEKIPDKRCCNTSCFGEGCKYLKNCNTYKNAPDLPYKEFKGDIKKND